MGAEPAATSPACQLSETLQRAFNLHRAGKLEQAQALYEEILAIAPRHSEAINLLGAIAIQTRNPQKAVALYERAIEIDPDSVVAHYNSGLALRELKQWEAALCHFDRAIAIRPGAPEAHFNRGNVLYELKQWQEALASYDRALALGPDVAEAYFNRGNVLYELERWQEALASYNQAIAIKPDVAETYLRRGDVLYALEQWQLALTNYDRAVALQADHAQAHSNRGAVLHELKELEPALASFERAIALQPDYAEAHSNRGVVLHQLKQWEAALASFAQAVAIKPDYAEAYCNRGLVLHELMRWQAALADFDRAIAIEADHAEAHFNRSLTLLLRGDLDQGWADYEWRGADSKEKRSFVQPLWLGQESIAGKIILLHSEQGLGDTLQFCRYARWVSALGARVILQVQEPLGSLLVGLAGVSQILTAEQAPPDFDFHCPLLSLPLVFKTRLGTIPVMANYLKADATKVARWQAKLGRKSCPRIGLVWSGHPNHKNDHNRSIPLAQLIPYLPSGLQYVSLQKEMHGRDWPGLTLQSNPEVLQYADELRDFSDTAALCECLDAVISVDTSVAHLSAALGRSTWILLPHHPDWRWLLDRADSPWYPTAKLYRQEKPGDWHNVFALIREQLTQAFPSRGV